MSQLWYNIYLPLVKEGTMSLAQLQAALAKNRITQAEYDDLVTYLPQ